MQKKSKTMKTHTSHSLAVGIIGYGQFGQLIAKELSKFFDIFVYSNNHKKQNKDSQKPDIQFVELDFLLSNSDFIIPAIPVQYLENLLLKIKSKDIKQGAVFVDVASVKIYPKKLFCKYLSEYEYLCTHPIFGPQSVAKYGLKGSKIVLSDNNIQEDKYNKIKSFLQDTLGLEILEISAKQHDKEMAQVQGITHFLARVLDKLDLEKHKTSTKPYEHMLELRDLLAKDSIDLFLSIEKYNPYVKAQIDRFEKEFKLLYLATFKQLD